jgi:hypothetical protein
LPVSFESPVQSSVSSTSWKATPIRSPKIPRASRRRPIPGDDRPARADHPKSDAVCPRGAKVGGLARVEFHATTKLHDLAVDEPSKRADELGEHPRVRGERPIEGAGQEQVTGEDADGVAPHGSRRRLPRRSRLSSMTSSQKRGRVDELGDHGELRAPPAAVQSTPPTEAR